MSRLVYRMVREKYAYDLSGKGAALYGGRWNPRGTYVLYTSQTPSLAMLEWLVNASEADAEMSYCMLTLQIPDAPIASYGIEVLPESWRLYPPPLSLQSYGQKLVNENFFLGMEIPSVVLPMEKNLVLNTRHPAFADIQIIAKDLITLDQRVIKH